MVVGDIISGKCVNLVYGRKHYIGQNLTFDIFVSKIQKEAHDSLLKVFLLVVDTYVLVNIVIVMFTVD